MRQTFPRFFVIFRFDLSGLSRFSAQLSQLARKGTNKRGANLVFGTFMQFFRIFSHVCLYERFGPRGRRGINATTHQLALSEMLAPHRHNVRAFGSRQDRLQISRPSIERRSLLGAVGIAVIGADQLRRQMVQHSFGNVWLNT